MKFLKKLLPKRHIGIIHINPYLSWGDLDALSEEQRAIRKRISAKLSIYQDKMVEYGNKINSYTVKRGDGSIITYSFSQLQHISADWDVDNDTIDLLATGSGGFKWRGCLDQFFTNDNFTALEK